MQRSCMSSSHNMRPKRRSSSYEDYSYKKQEMCEESCVEEEDNKETKTSSPILGKKKHFRKCNALSPQTVSSFCSDESTNSCSPMRARKNSSTLRMAHSSPTSSADHVSIHRKIIQRNIIPLDKRTQSRGCSYQKHALLSPVGSKKSTEAESPLSSFVEKEDSLIGSIDFEELDSICLSVMSTPKSSVSSRKNKKARVSEKECTPKRNIYSSEENHYSSEKRCNHSHTFKLNESPRDIYISGRRSCKKDVQYKSCIENDSELCHERTEDSPIIERVHNTSGVSFLGGFGDEDSPDLFEATPVSKSYAVSKSRGSNFESETDLFSDETDMFKGVSDSHSKFEENFKDHPTKKIETTKNNCILKTFEADTKNFQVPGEPLSSGAPSFVSSESNVNAESYSVENASSSDSQVSFSSTMESQPLIARLQGRLDGFQSTQTCGVIQTENELRAELVEAAVKEAEKIHESANEFELGPFFGLPSLVAEALRKHRGIQDLYDWQKDCIAEGIGSKNLLFSLPTSGGKTLVAEILMLRQLLLKKKDTLFILPYVALVQEKVHGISPFGVELGFLVEEYAGSRGSFPPKTGRKK
ncbi:helicase POLQ-like [Macrobrachium nipponense]|uniref:helicase POLQ-like n=1 Tax=Macrobrachium nipponense TaxID=159736 RepID=UPI0030C88CB2